LLLVVIPANAGNQANRYNKGMTIKNKTKQTTISENVTISKTEKEKIIGLIGEKYPKAIMFQTRFGIHTFFMNFPIDILILNKQNHVVVIKKNLKPNRLFFWNPNFTSVIELPQGTIENTQTALHDILTIEQ
jgi:uncharacterized membrane protein (UPF0127 family)